MRSPLLRHLTPLALRLLLALATSLASAAALASERAPLPTVESLDLARYVGTWYEIALLPNYFERECVADTQAQYSMDGAGIRVVNRCRLADGRIDTAKGHAKVVADSGNAKLRVSFFWPFYGDYWVLAIDPDYREVLVGAPDRRYAWILARSPELPEERLRALLERAKTLGFDAAAFRRTPQLHPYVDQDKHRVEPIKISSSR